MKTLLKTMPFFAGFSWFDPYENTIYMKENWNALSPDDAGEVWSYNMSDGTTTQLSSIVNHEQLCFFIYFRTS